MAVFRWLYPPRFSTLSQFSASRHPNCGAFPLRNIEYPCARNRASTRRGTEPATPTTASAPRANPPSPSALALTPSPLAACSTAALGVVAALGVLRRVKESNLELNRPIKLVATREEEGRFCGMVGAQAIAGDLMPDFILNAHDADGNRLTDAMTAAGLDPLKVLDARRAPESMRAWLELHVERGPVLEQTGDTVGIVDGISGAYKWIVRLIGKADHAGTAPMNMRSNAFMGLADFAHEIPRIDEGRYRPQPPRRRQGRGAPELEMYI